MSMSDTLTLLGVFAMAGAATSLTRLSFIALEGKLRLPAWFRHALQFVPAAILTALITPDLLLRNGALALGFDNHRLLAAIVAVVVAAWSRSVGLTIAIGMGVLILLEML
ncbi:AzlD domain-containing protein [Imbroritus primus]|uniref:AzlD domain-containing protein n=1 Tax=Imbroritus primus TaxID=3058603 RepID=A0ACD3SJX4_9BURK|nr:AzlD domain-containing protein [Burkholderiaceae bacterium PBA]